MEPYSRSGPRIPMVWRTCTGVSGNDCSKITAFTVVWSGRGGVTQTSLSPKWSKPFLGSQIFLAIRYKCLKCGCNGLATAASHCLASLCGLLEWGSLSFSIPAVVISTILNIACCSDPRISILLLDCRDGIAPGRRNSSRSDQTGNSFLLPC